MIHNLQKQHETKKKKNYKGEKNVSDICPCYEDTGHTVNS